METKRTHMKKNKKQSGFSLIELMVVILLMMIITGAIFEQIDMVQRRYRSEQNKMDLFQNAREFVDQFVRDVHTAGYPNPRLFTPDAVWEVSPAANSMYNAVGLIHIDPRRLVFEGDINGDGVVDMLEYKLDLDTTAAGNSRCPCLKRGQGSKTSGAAPGTTVLDYFTQVENVVADNTTEIFTAFDRDGAPVDISAGLDRTNFEPNSTETIYRIYNVRIRLNVRASTIAGDIGTGFRPEVFISAGAQVNN
jgi:prepilin-type N-terminal cleavage/methylation domain-containing protein